MAESFENQVSDALSLLQRFGNGIISRVSGRCEEDEVSMLVEKWKELSKIVTGALRDNENGLSIKQSRYQSQGVYWTETSIPDFMSNVNRIIYSAKLNDEEVIDYVKKQGVQAVDRINEVVWNRLMMSRPSGGSANFKEAVETDREEEAPNQLSCPYSECKSKFGTTKALKQHIKKYHQNQPSSNIMVQESKKIHCVLCPYDKGQVAPERMKEHLRRVHKKGPYTKEFRFCGFEETSPGTYEPIFIKPNIKGNLGLPLNIEFPVPTIDQDSSDGIQSGFTSPVKTFASMSEPPSQELMFQMSLSDKDVSLTSPSSELKSHALCSSTPIEESTMLRRTPEDEIITLGARRKLDLSSGKNKKKKKMVAPKEKKKRVDDQDDWTDHEVGDDEEYTERRRAAKEARYKERLTKRVQQQPLYLKEGNKEFIDTFNSHVLPKKSQSNIHKYTRYLFRGENSWLDHITQEKNGDFLLKDLIDWTGQRLQYPGSPDAWFQKVPDNPKEGSKKTEMAKAYSKFLTYLTSLTQKRMLDQACNYETNVKLNFHKDMLIATKQQMLGSGFLSGAKKLSTEHVETKKQNLNILYPDLAQKIRDCVKIWNKSQTKEDDLRKFVQIYETAKKAKKVSSTGYKHCVQHTVMNVSILNANRKASIEALKNSDFRGAKKVFQNQEGEELLIDEGEFFGKYIQLMPSSGASKTGNPVTVFFNTHILDLMHMLKDLATWYFVGDEMDKLEGLDLDAQEAPLFRSANGQAAKVDKLTYEKFAKESDLPGASANTLRQTATTNYRNDPKLCQYESADMDHNKNVATSHYDKGVQERKVRSRQIINERNEGDAVTLSAIDYVIDENTRERWRNEEDAQTEIMKENAARYLKDSKRASNPVKNFSSQWRVLPNDRQMLTNTILSAHGTEIHSRVAPPSKFPTDKPTDSVWTRTFYRYVDTLPDTETGSKIRDIEARIFHEVVKQELTREGVWKEGKVDNGQQRQADREVAARLRTSFWNQARQKKTKGTASPLFNFTRR